MKESWISAAIVRNGLDLYEVTSSQSLRLMFKIDQQVTSTGLRTFAPPGLAAPCGVEVQLDFATPALRLTLVSIPLL